MEDKYTLNQPFNEWHKDNLIEFLEFIKNNYPKEFRIIYHQYEEWLRGN